MTAILPALLAVGFIVGLGILAGRTLAPDSKTLSQLVVYILAPALVVESLYKTEMALQAAIAILGAFTLTTVALYTLVKGITYYSPQPLALHKSLLLTVLLPNNGNMGLPLVAFTLGEKGLERAIIYLIGSSILLFGVMPALLSAQDTPGPWIHRCRQTLQTAVQLPLTWAIAVGLGLKILNIALPLSLENTLYQLGQASIVLCLLLLGIQLSQTPFRPQGFEMGVIPLRLLVGPLLAYGIGRALTLGTLDLQVVVLQSAMPVAVNSVALAAEFGGDAAKVSRSVVATTLGCLLTLPLMVEWLMGA